MTDYAALLQPDRGQAAHALHIVDAAGFDAWMTAQPADVRAVLSAQGLTAKPGVAIVPGDDWSAVAVVEDAATLGPWCLARLAETLPAGSYRLASGDAGAAVHGWLSAQYRFTRYRAAEDAGARVLLTCEVGAIDAAVRVAAAVAMVRDLVNTGASDLGPAELEAEAASLARRHGAELSVIRGEALAEGYPMIHAVGQAASRARAPRLVELHWGDPGHPLVAIVGKGVCFDSGGLDIKPAAGMRLMKKDMGGAAHALALAALVMGAGLPVRLHLLVPAVENAISADAFRPGDVLRSRKGLTVENTNTDAEGRLILGDALARATESDAPDLLLDFATLTGAARVALGPDLPALFSNSDALSAAFEAAATQVGDPLWRLPLWAGYNAMLRSDVADLVNAPDGGMAGAVTAALFLQRFVPDGVDWAHLDTFAWRPTAKPGRPKGGEALGLRAAWAMLEARYRRR